MENHQLRKKNPCMNKFTTHSKQIVQSKEKIKTFDLFWPGWLACGLCNVATTELHLKVEREGFFYLNRLGRKTSNTNVYNSHFLKTVQDSSMNKTSLDPLKTLY